MGGTESVKMLIDMGADVTVKDVDLRSCVRVAVGHAATMEILLQVSVLENYLWSPCLRAT